MPRIVIVHETLDGDVIIPETLNDTYREMYKSHKISELRPMTRGATQYVAYPVPIIRSSEISNDIVITKDSSYIGYIVPGVYTCANGEAIYHITPSIISSATSPIPIESLIAPISGRPLNTYDNVSIYQWT